MTQINIKPLANKSLWEEFIHSNPQANFLQSYKWGLFQSKLDKKFFPLGIFANEEQVGAAMIIKEEAKRGDYLTIAGGPILNWEDDEIETIFREFIKHISGLAQKENCVFVRIRPQALDNSRIRALFEKNDLQPSPMHLTADLTLQLGLDQDEEKLLMQMRKNTRYYIRRSKRDGVYTKIISDPDFMDDFYKHQLYLADKHNFVPFSYDFLRLQFEEFAADDQAAFINSYIDDKLLASAFIIFYNQEAVYHYGISTPDNDDWPGSYATQWAAILEAKKRGCKKYNFWGGAPEDQPEHRFAGVSLFKRGFGGEEIQYLPAHDLSVSSWYKLTKGFELIRKKVRGL